MVHLLSGDGHKGISFSFGKMIITTPSTNTSSEVTIDLMYSSAYEVYIYLRGFAPHGSSPFGDGFNREMESSLPFYKSFPCGSSYRGYSSAPGRLIRLTRPPWDVIVLLSGWHQGMPSWLPLFGNNFLRKLLYRFSLRSPTSSNPFGSGPCRFSFFM